MMECRRFLPAFSRRQMLRASACGFGQVVLAALAANRARADAGPWSTPHTPGAPHFPPRARRIIFLFMWGGPSHVDLFDPKPRLSSESGKPLSGKSVGSDRGQLGTVLGSPFQFSRHGHSGIWMSELLPHLSRHADRMCVIRSLHTEGTAH